MSLKNAFSLLLRQCLDPIGIRLVRLTPNKVRGIDPLLDIAYLLAGNENPTIFDVGANDGEVVSECLKLFPNARIVAFEPYQACCDKLLSRFGTNPNIRVENIALGAEHGISQLNLYSGDRMNSLLQLDNHAANLMLGKFKQVGSARVEVRTLDAFCERNEIRDVDVLKVDTQGFDLQVLRGATTLLEERRIGTILLEANFIPMYEQQASFCEIHDFLTPFGYRLVDLYNQVRSRGFTAWCDVCYVAADEPCGRLRNIA